ncbi:MULTISPECIES: metal ABC transporter solute-binding protein, Zn/Mn family [Streptococcus]
MNILIRKESIVKRKYLALGFALLCCLLVPFMTGCQKQPKQTKDGLHIVTSFYPIYAMTKYISGNLNDVKMIQSRAGIHSFEPSPNDVAAIYDADLFVYHSHTLEAWAGKLDASKHHSKVKIVEASKSLTLDKVEGLEDMPVTDGVDPARLYDPHTWSDPLLAADEADIIAKQLAAIDPKHRLIYEKNAKSFREETENIDHAFQAKFKKVKTRTFVTQHTAFSYLAKRYKLKQIGIAGISPEQEPTPRQLTEIRDFIKTYQVKTIFVEKNVSQKLAKTVAHKTGVKLKLLSPLESDPENNKSYLENVKENLTILYNELR